MCDSFLNTLRQQMTFVEITWEDLKEGLFSRYGHTEYGDFFEDLTKPKQNRNVREYLSQFKRLLSRVIR